MTLNELYWVTESKIWCKIISLGKTLYEGTVHDIPMELRSIVVTYITIDHYGRLSLVVKENK